MSPKSKLPSTKVSVVVTLGLVVLAGVLGFIGISVLLRGISESASEPAFVAGAAPTQIVETETPIPPTEPNDVTPTPLVIMGVPNDVTPPPTYAVGPTAQFTELIPTSKWLTYEDKQAGFTFKYPPDWYLVASPEQERVAGYSLSVHSYDPQDPNLSILGKSGKWPSNYTKLEITLDSPEAEGHPLEPNEDLADWVHRTRPLQESEQTLSEKKLRVDGIDAFEQITQSENSPSWSVIYLYSGKYMMFIAHPYEKEEIFNYQVIQTILSSMQFHK